MADRSFGRIILVASDTVWSPPGEAFLPYIASKAAMLAVMRTLASSLGGNGIAVIAVAPGLTETPTSTGVVSRDQIELVVAHQAMKRPLVPPDTAATVAFLASAEAEPLTGQVLVVDGGLLMR